MNRTLGVALGFAVIVAGLLSIASEPAGAQAGAVSGYVVPRTPWGDPDLQGNLTNLYETGTPLEKPDAFAGRRMEDVTKEEVRAERERIEKRAIERRLNAPGVQGGTPEIFLDAYQHEKGSVLWFITDPEDGKVPPLTPEGEARQRAGRGGGRVTREGAGDSYENRSLYDRCTSRGLPNSMMPTIYGNSYQIIQGRGYVAIRYEMIHETRVIPLDGRPHMNPKLHFWMGDARGHWEGDSLLVETTNFREDMTPRGANPARLRLVERFTRVAPDKIHWSVTYDDPTTWTRPWTHMVPLTIDDSQAIVEYACHEGNYFMWNSLRGDRQKEYDAKVAGRAAGR